MRSRTETEVSSVDIQNYLKQIFAVHNIQRQADDMKNTAAISDERQSQDGGRRPYY
jgi:hypothetical protein